MSTIRASAMHTISQYDDIWGSNPYILPDIISADPFAELRSTDELYLSDGTRIGSVNYNVLYLVYGSHRKWATWGLCPSFRSNKILAPGTPLCRRVLTPEDTIRFDPVSIVTYHATDGDSYLYALSVPLLNGVFTSIHKYEWSVTTLNGDFVYGNTVVPRHDVHALSIPNTHSRIYQQPYLVIHKPSTGAHRIIIGTASGPSSQKLNIDSAATITFNITDRLKLFPGLSFL